MAISLLHYTSCVLIIIICIGHGDGRWKKREKENLYREIDAFQRMAEKIEQEIDAFYEDYPDERIKGDDIEKIQVKHIKNILHHKTSAENTERKRTHDFSYTGNISNAIPALDSENSAQSSPIHVSFANNESLDVASSWPKFEDILLDMGKRYDWKNDRWIKVKRKFKPMKKAALSAKSLEFHEKHRFSYKTVRLNSTRRSRKNVVIAVTAVR